MIAIGDSFQFLYHINAGWRCTVISAHGNGVISNEMTPGRSWLREEEREALRPEAELLLACARLRLSPAEAARVCDLLEADLDWDYLLQAASRHGVLPLLHRHLSGAAPDLVPAAAVAVLREEVHENAAWNLLLTSELTKILALLEGQGIPAVPFKGPALAAFVYGGISLRQFVDLDLFLRREDLPFTKRRLVPRGYEPEISLSENREQAYLKSQYHSIMVNRVPGSRWNCIGSLPRGTCISRLRPQACGTAWSGGASPALRYSIFPRKICC